MYILKNGRGEIIKLQEANIIKDKSQKITKQNQTKKRIKIRKHQLKTKRKRKQVNQEESPKPVSNLQNL